MSAGSSMAVEYYVNKTKGVVEGHVLYEHLVEGAGENLLTELAGNGEKG
jgi:hypothetical protein